MWHRIPRFAADYLLGGIGGETCLRRNREVLSEVKLRSRGIRSTFKPELDAEIFGRQFDAPFGIAPIGLSGLVWPRAAEHMAASARLHNVPFALSSFATTDLETARAAAGENAWFQLYATRDPAIENDLIDRAETAGYEVLLVTIDIPTSTPRERDIANGLSVPPRLTLQTIAQVAARPRWALQTLIDGIPRFASLKPYIPEGVSIDREMEFLHDAVEGHVSREKLARIRERWSGTLVVKGVLSVEDASFCASIGVDGMVVSNHGGRQLDASPHALDVLPDIRAAVGEGMRLIVDGGIRSGLDIARIIASGADFALLGRAFVCATGAAGRPGCDRAMALLKNELRHTLAQLGCEKIADLPNHLIAD